MSRLARTFAAFAACILVTVAGAPPPKAPAIDHVETVFGITFSDPYFWMEAGGQAFDDWMSAQADYTRHMLASIPGRVEILAQLRGLDREETYVGRVVRAGTWWVYSKLLPTDSSAKIFIRPVAAGAERVLIDAREFDTNGLTAHIDYWSVAPDGRHIAYGVSLGGSETGVLHNRSIETGIDLPDQIDRTRYITPSWVDDAAFLYTRLPKPAPGQAQSLTGGHVYLHRLGSDPATDIEVFGPGEMVGLHVGADYFFRGLASPDSGEIVGIYDAGLTSSPKAVFVADKAALGSTLTWHQLAGLQDDIRYVVLHRDMLYLSTARDSPHQRIIRTPASTPDIAHAATVVAEGEGTVAGMVAAADALYVRYNERGFDRLARVPWDGAAESVATPFEGSFTSLTADATSPGVVLAIQDWTHSATVFAYDPDHRNFADTGIAPPSPTSFDDIQLIELRVPAADGAMIPLSIIAPRGIARDKRHPVLMYAYGAYGASISPSFSALRRAWLDRGGIYAIAHVRGSGGFGDAWYRAGRLEKKINSISDFIDSADYLVRSGWATPTMLSAVGGSAGGIVIGGAVAERPDLFSAAIINVGLVNPLRLEQIPIGPFNTEEFGSSKTEAGLRTLASIDPYYKLKYGTSYPGIMVSTQRNDTRIPPWMPAKFAARLQAATTGPRPILLRVDPAGGHSFETKEQVETALADAYAFLLWQAGVPEFQPTP